MSGLVKNISFLSKNFRNVFMVSDSESLLKHLQNLPENDTIYVADLVN